MRNDNVATQTSVELDGTIDRIRYRGENGFAIASIRTGKNDLERVSVKGNLGAVNEEDELRFTGTWFEDPKYGKQFNVFAAKPVIPTEAAGIARWIEKYVPGIGKRGAELLVAKFGKEAVKVLDPRDASKDDPLLELPSMNPEKAAHARACYAELGNFPEMQLWLAQHNIVGAYAARLVKFYRGETRVVLEADPYKPIKDVEGFGFKRSDDLAKALGIEGDDPRRAKAAVVYAFDEKASDGHVYLSAEDLEVHLAGEYSIPVAVTRAAVATQIAANEIVEEKGRLYSRRLHAAEVRLCYDILRIHEAPDDGLQPTGVAAPFLNDEQRAAVLAVFKHRVVVITGGPGRGKTTIAKEIQRLADPERNTTLAIAPTGKAAKRLSLSIGMGAATVHRGLEYGPPRDESGNAIAGPMAFRRNAERRLEQKLLLLDETSMLDVELAAALFEAVPTGARVVLFGDIDQLPSVGPGAVLKDLIASEVIPVIRLVRNMRQAEGSAIANVAGKIVEGQFLDDTDLVGEVSLLEVENAETAAEEIVRLLERGIPGYADPSQVQVLCPKKAGPVGAEKLNQMLQARLNPPKPGNDAEMKFGDLVLRAGDKVIVTKNDYDLGVFNGDTGLVHIVDVKAKSLVVAMDDGQRVIFPRESVKILTLAYAISVHRSQGSEYPCVVMPVHKADGRMINRQVLYTGITRARQRLLLVGDKAAIKRAIKNVDPSKRNTTLDGRLPWLIEHPGAFK